MDSGLSHISPHALQSLRVVRGPYALTWGAGTLSAIRAETFKPAFGGDGFQVGGRVGGDYGSNLQNPVIGRVFFAGSRRRGTVSGRDVASEGWR